MKKTDLIPADPNRCQTEWTEYKPFIMGGNVNQKFRCEKVPVVLVTEKVPGEDGQCGSMSMCYEHLEIFKKQHPKIAETAFITPI